MFVLCRSTSQQFKRITPDSSVDIYLYSYNFEDHYVEPHCSLCYNRQCFSTRVSFFLFYFFYCVFICLMGNLHMDVGEVWNKVDYYYKVQTFACDHG